MFDMPGFFHWLTKIENKTESIAFFLSDSIRRGNTEIKNKPPHQFRIQTGRLIHFDLKTHHSIKKNCIRRSPSVLPSTACG